MVTLMLYYDMFIFPYKMKEAGQEQRQMKLTLSCVYLNMHVIYVGLTLIM
jgi:hypothetical protein